jgi:hypothetical protein
MIWLFRRFRSVSYIDRAISIWTEADRHIADLAGAGERLHDAVSSLDRVTRKGFVRFSRTSGGSTPT